MKKKRNYLLFLLKCFLLFLIPPFIFSFLMVVLNSLYYLDLIKKLFLEILIFGSLGILLSLIYLFLDKHLPKYSRIISLIVVIAYYIVFLVFIIVAIYFRVSIPIFLEI